MTKTLSPEPSAAGTPQPLACNTSTQRWSTYLSALMAQAENAEPLETVGTLVRVAGLVLEAAGVRVPVGSICEVRSPGLPVVLAEVVGSTLTGPT
jgi:flagellum-specific ATP synthase